MIARSTIFLASFILGLGTGLLPAHDGEDHSGASLSATAGPGMAGPLYVPVETQMLAQIETRAAKRETVANVFRVLGRTIARPEREAVVSAPKSGRLLPVGEGAAPGIGDRVEKGQVLAVVEESIDAADLVTIAADRARAASELIESEAELHLSQREYDRVAKLADVVPEKEVAAARSALEVATAKHDGLVAQVALLDERAALGVPALQRRDVVAPSTGVVAEVRAVLDENVEAGKVLYRIVDLSELLVEADVFETDIASVVEATSATLRVEAFPGVGFPARLVSRGTAVDERSRALHVLFAVPNPDGKLFAGMSGTVFIERGTSAEGITIPKSAVVDVDGQSVAYVKTSGEQFVARPLRIAERLSDRVLLQSDGQPGIKEGDRVVVQGSYQVRMSKAVSAPALAAPKKP